MTQSATKPHAVEPQALFVEGVSEEEMARLIGSTPKALERKRQRKVYPEGKVWAKIDGRIIYHIPGYNAWIRSHFNQTSRQASSSTETEYESASTGMEKDTGNRSRSRPRQKTYSGPVVCVVK
ncbi:hypothetical protein [Marinobacterium iners]|uniref:hypothetical protein n=1 Tax=Marinobacterium iners TaxID=48076 RepID=UPI0020C841A2|nr:hypothetical protein [Marinobacterium iners]